MTRKTRAPAARAPAKAAVPEATLHRALRSGMLLLFLALPFALDLRLSTPIQGQERFLEVGAFALVLVYLAPRVFGSASSGFHVSSLLAGGIGVLLLASALAAPNRSYALASSLLSISGIGLFFVLRGVARGGDLLPRLGGLLTVQAALLAAYALAQAAGLELLPYVPDPDAKSRAVATFGNPNFLASYLGPALFVCLAWSVGRKGALRTIALGGAALIVLALLQTKARAVLLGVLLGLVFVSVAFLRRILVKAPREKARMLVAAALVAVGVVFVSPRLVGGVSGANVESRLYFFRIAAALRAPAWPLGLGRGGFAHAFWSAVEKHQMSPDGALYARNLESLAAKDGRALDPGGVHDDYLELLAEGGPLALFLHLALVGHVLVAGARRSMALSPDAPRAALLTAGFLVSLVDSVLGFPLALPASLALFWLLAAMLAPVPGEPP